MCCKEDETEGKGRNTPGRDMCCVQTIRSVPRGSQGRPRARRCCAHAYGVLRSTCRSTGRSDTRPPTRACAARRPRPIPRYPCPQTTVHAPGARPAARYAAHGQGPPRSRPPRKSRLLPVPEHEGTRHQQPFHAARRGTGGRHARTPHASGGATTASARPLGLSPSGPSLLSLSLSLSRSLAALPLRIWRHLLSSSRRSLSPPSGY